MKIAFVSGKLSDGGSERAVAEMAGYWASRGHAVSVITYVEEPGPRDYPLDPAVHRISIFSRTVWRLPLPVPVKVIPRLVKLRRTLRKIGPDVVISMILGANLSTLIATVGMNMRVVGQQVIAVESRLSTWYMRLLRRLLFRRLDAFVIQSQRLIDSASLVVAREKIHVIPRHVSPSFSTDDFATDGSRWHDFPGGRPAARVVAMGRLADSKGFDLLIAAAARLPSTLDFGVLILGQGEQRATLERTLKQLGLEGHVWLAGWSDDPRPTLRDSTVFVLPSRKEGWPNALLQAMAQGLPVVASDCPTGPAEIVTNRTDGLLVPPGDVDALAAAIEELLADDILRDGMGAAGRSVRERFAIDRIMGMWEEVLPR